MASRQSSLSATTIGSDSNGVVQGSGLLDAQAGARVEKWGSVQQLPHQQMQFQQMQQWTVTLRVDQRVEEKLVARRRVEDVLAAQILETAERKVKQLAEESFNRAADEEKRTKRPFVPLKSPLSFSPSAAVTAACSS